MSHEHEHEHSQAAPKRTSRFGPERGWTGTGQPAEDHGLTPAQEQQWRAARLHQGRQVLQGWAARAAARAGAPTDAAHAAHDGHAAHRGHAVQEGTEATRAAPASGWPGFDQVHFDQVYNDVAGGKFAVALGLLDRYWPLGARDRDFVGGLIVTKLYAALVPLTMEAMLRALADVRTHLDEVIIGGHRLRDLLLYPGAGPAPNRDRLAYALAILTDGAKVVTHETQPSYIANHFEDLHGAQVYLESQGAKGVVPDETLDPRESVYSEFLGRMNDKHSLAVEQGIADAVSAVGYDPVLYGAWWTNMIGLAIAGAGCLVPELAVPLEISSTAVGIALQGLSSMPSLSGPQLTFAQRVAANVGNEVDHDAQTSWLSIFNRIRDAVHTQHQLAVQNHWGHYQLIANLLQKFWRLEFVLVGGNGLVDLDGDAIQKKTKRDVLLAAVDKKGVGGRLVYEYTATNVFHTQGVDSADSVYYDPTMWTYHLDNVMLAVTPQLVAALNDQQKKLPIVSSDVTAPATIIVTTPSYDGTSQRVYLSLDDKDNVVGYAPTPRWTWDGQRVRPLELSLETWGQKLETSAWHGTDRPQLQVSAVVQQTGGSL